jgi:predicted MFS family arabinose efflux permease
MNPIHTPKKHPELTTLTLWIMTITTGLVVANIYYNQPLLGDIAKTFKISNATAANVSMITALGYAAGIFFIAPLADVVKRKRLMLGAFVIDIIALICVPLAPDYPLLMVASFLVGAASLIPQLLMPMAAHLAKPSERGKKIGVVMSGLLIGILASRTMSGLVGQYFGWQAMFYIASGLMVVMGLLVLFFLPEIEPDHSASYPEVMKSLYHIFISEPKLRFAALRGALCFGCFMAFWTTLTFLLEDNFHLGSREAGYYGLLGIAGALAAGFMGRLSDKMDAFKLSFFTLLLITVSFVIFYFSGHSLVGLAIGVIVLDAGVQATHISNQAMIFALDANSRNRLNTIYMVSYFVGGSLGTKLVSMVWESYHWQGVCITGGILSLIAIIVHLLNHRSMQNRPAVV